MRFSTSKLFVRFFAVILLGLFATDVLRGDEQVINLLQLPSCKVVDSADHPSDDSFAALRDGDLRHATRFGEPGATLQVLFDLGDSPATATQWHVQLAESEQMLRVDLLASTVSKQAGFRLLRSDMLDQRASQKPLEFAPAAARWLLVRLSPADDKDQVALAEISVFGYEGTPKSQYPFNTSPTKALDVLASLRVSESIEVGLDPAESQLFEDTADGTLHNMSFAEASLLSSGVFDAAKRAQYLKQLDDIESSARNELRGARTPFEKGQRLLTWLHRKDGPLSAGYVARQTDLSVLLDTKTYNCVSSATIYNILGRRLGLDLRAIEVPDHAFSILYDGTKHADVETTTASGFNPARDELGRKAFEERTGFRYIPDSHRGERREVNAAGLIAITYYNHAVTLAKEKQHNRALLAYFRAMSMDPEFASAVNNSLASLVNWAADLEKAGAFEESVAINAIGLQLAPRDAALRHNRSVTYTRWAKSLAETGDDDAALVVLRRAAQLMPDDHFVSMQAWQYIRRAEDRIEHDEWREALNICSTGAVKIDATARDEIEKWQNDFYLRWSNYELKAKRFEHAVALIEEGLSRGSDDARLTGNLVYAIQEWTRDTYKETGAEAARQLLATQLDHFKDHQGVAEVAQNHARRVFIQLRDQRKFREAIDSLADNEELFHDAKEPTSLYRDGYCSWARHCMANRDWEQTLIVYRTGLEQLPGDSRLTGNLTYFVQEWAKDLLAEEGAAAARDMLLEQSEQFSSIKKLTRVAEQFASNLAETSLRANNYDEALKVLDENRKLLSDKETLRLARRVFDQHASVYQAKKDWRAAIDVYLEGLKLYPEDRHMTHNAVVFCHQWAEGFMKQQDWDGAIGVYEKSLIMFPDASSLKQNLRYCEQEKSRAE